MSGELIAPRKGGLASSSGAGATLGVTLHQQRLCAGGGCANVGV